MLKTNSKKARENVIRYIMDHENTAEITGKDPENFSEAAAAIYADFDRVTNTPINRRTSMSDRFAEYAAGLPGILDTCYYYNRSALDDLGGILEETEAEKAKYSETEAEKLLSYLIYREIERSVRA